MLVQVVIRLILYTDQFLSRKDVVIGGGSSDDDDDDAKVEALTDEKVVSGIDNTVNIQLGEECGNSWP